MGRLASVRRAMQYRYAKGGRISFIQDSEQTERRWLLTTCAAGVVGTFFASAAVLGLLGDNSAGNAALASVMPGELWQSAGASVLPKQDLDLQEAEPVDADALRVTSVAFRPQSEEAKDDPVIPARLLTGSIASQYPSITANSLPYRIGEPTVIDGSFANAFSPSNITTIAKTPPPEPVDETIQLAKGANLFDHVVALGVTPEAARALVASIEPVYPTNLLKPGQQFVVTLDKQPDFFGNDVIYPVRLSFASGPDEEVVVEADEDGQFAAHVETDGEKERARSRYAVATHYRAGGNIGSSLYTTAMDDRVPSHIISQMLQVFSYTVDFQRQIKAGDTYEVFYGNPISGSSTKRAVLLYASLTLGGNKKVYYRHTTKDGQTAYFDEKGLSASKFLMRTPVSGARLTSGYGIRRHPLLGYSKMHAGVDFGLPYGAPIKAAGSGVVELAGRSGAYGIAVKISHSKGYETLYAHMSKVAAGVRPGGRVNQGQVIGYVGSTGRSTGPHLHYEVRINDKPVNPLKVKAAGGRQLAGNELKEFNARRQTIVALMQKTPSTRLARAGD